MSLTSFKPTTALLAASLGLAAPAPTALAQEAKPQEATTEVQSHPAPANDEKPLPDAEKDPWRAQFNLWIWLMGIDGTLGVKGTKADVSASFLDILDNSDSIMAFSGRIELGYDRLGFYFDGLYTQLGVDDARGPDGLDSFDITYDQTTIDFGVMYRIGEWKPTSGADLNPRMVTLDAYAGARYMNLDLEIDPSIGDQQKGNKNWFDPVVGLKLIVPFAKHWHLAINGDIGGFGAASQFCWSSTGLVGYDFELFGHPASFLFGYRIMDWDYTDGSGSNEFTWDLRQQGAMLGFELLF